MKMATRGKVDVVFFTKLGEEEYEVSYLEYDGKPRKVANTYRTKEEAEKVIEEIERSRPLTIFWDDIALL
ncbi:hypothetical protein [Streptococcus pneumoniae]|uniref:hypothetical protein n=1 Tax=Streptococcus pneumoniae TaxID=1313 RepID=UPI0019D40564|nr:hypothetical protein [Streptococcus pneumoniae]